MTDMHRTVEGVTTSSIGANSPGATQGARIGEVVARGHIFDGRAECYVLRDGRRALSQRGLIRALTSDFSGERRGPEPAGPTSALLEEFGGGHSVDPSKTSSERHGPGAGRERSSATSSG